MRTSATFVAVLLVLGTVPVANAGIRWTTEQSTPQGVVRVTLSVEGDRLRVESLPAAGEPVYVLLFDRGTGKLRLIDPSRGRYTELPPPEPELDADRRAKLEAERKARTAPPAAAPKVVPTGQKRTVAGLPCAVVRVLDGAVALEEDCVAAWSEGTMTLAEATAYEKLVGAMPALGGDEPAGARVTWALLGGFPLVRTYLGANGAIRATTTVTKLERVAIPAADLAVPAAYTK